MGLFRKLATLILKFLRRNKYKELRVLTKSKDRESPIRHGDTSRSHRDSRRGAHPEAETDADGTKDESRHVLGRTEVASQVRRKNVDYKTTAWRKLACRVGK